LREEGSTSSGRKKGEPMFPQGVLKDKKGAGTREKTRNEIPENQVFLQRRRDLFGRCQKGSRWLLSSEGKRPPDSECDKN